MCPPAALATVTRFCQVVRTGKTLKFSTQDTTLIEKDENGTMRQSTHKTADADAKMIDAIGVPKVCAPRQSQPQPTHSHTSRHWAGHIGVGHFLPPGGQQLAPPGRCRRAEEAGRHLRQQALCGRHHRLQQKDHRAHQDCGSTRAPATSPLPSSPACSPAAMQEFKTNLARAEELQKEAVVQRGNRAEVGAPRRVWGCASPSPHAARHRPRTA